jgi:hypothetical protein
MLVTTRDFSKLLGFITGTALLFYASCLIPLRAQQADTSARKTRSSSSAATAPSRSDQDFRMASFQARAKARWRAQQIVARKAEADYHKARLDREIAEIKVLDYREGKLPQDLATVEGEVALAESDLSRAEDRLEWAKRMFAKRYLSQAVRISEELSFKRAQFNLEQAQARKRVLVEFTKDKTIKELEAEFEKARSSELAKKSSWELEKSRESELERRATQVKGARATSEPR